LEIFLICPVRKAGDAVNERIAAYVAELESGGDHVHWPKRDTKQDGDPVGIRICRDNREAMFVGDEVHVWYDLESRGSCLDIGMATVFDRTHPGQVVIANRDDFLAAPASPQFSLLLSLVAHAFSRPALMSMKNRWEECPPESLSRHVTLSGDIYTFHTPPNDTGALCMYGMVFALMRSKPRKVVLDFSITPTPNKSFDNVLLWLAEETKNGPCTV